MCFHICYIQFYDIQRKNMFEDCFIFYCIDYADGVLEYVFTILE